MTLIEIMIALVILMIVALAMMQIALIGINTNLQNALRDEAVNVADLKMNELRDMQFDMITVGIGTSVVSYVTRTFRGGAVVTLQSTQTGSLINADTKQVNVSVQWPFRGNYYTHSVTSIVRRQ